MKEQNYQLIAEEIQNTLHRLYLRINDRFPGSGLASVCRSLHKISLETDKKLEWISKPNYFLRGFTYAVISGVLLATFYSISTMDLASDRLSVSDLIQMLGSALEGGAIACAGIIFIVTLENRRKRIKVITSINRLRGISHIIDMHQLTKDPEATGKHAVPTKHSPKRKLTKYELCRYLNYCSEMLSLTSKLGFLYVQTFPDPVASDAVNDLEELTTDLCRKIWQKIMLINGGEKMNKNPTEPKSESV